MGLGDCTYLPAMGVLCLVYNAMKNKLSNKKRGSTFGLKRRGQAKKGGLGKEYKKGGPKG